MADLTYDEILNNGGTTQDFYDYGYSPMSYQDIASSGGTTQDFLSYGYDPATYGMDSTNYDYDPNQTNMLPVEGGGWITADGTYYNAQGQQESLMDDATGALTAAGAAVKKFLGSAAGATALRTLGGMATTYMANQAAQTGNQNAMSGITSANEAAQLQLQPYVIGGQQAYSNLQGMAAQPTPEFNYDPNNYYNSPVYQNLQRAGTDAVASQSAASGMYGSGNMANALMERSQQIGAQYMPIDQSIQQQNYQNYLGAVGTDYSRQASLAGTGLTALGRSSELGAGAAQNIANIYNTSGVNNANALISMGNTAMSGINSFLNK